MALTGPPPSENKRRRNADTFAWVDVVSSPFDGSSPDLPDALDGNVLVARWYEAIRSMPHCRLWTASDWMFAVSTAFVALDAFSGERPAAFGELRQREAKMGVTLEDRMKLRIRYVPPEVGEGSARTPKASAAPKRRLKVATSKSA